jgi:hypothetical protein
VTTSRERGRGGRGKIFKFFETESHVDLKDLKCG